MLSWPWGRGERGRGITPAPTHTWGVWVPLTHYLLQALQTFIVLQIPRRTWG